MDNKDVIAQSVMQHEGLYKLSVLLDQFKDGLRRTNKEKLIENYPKEFAPLFIMLRGNYSYRCHGGIVHEERQNRSSFNGTTTTVYTSPAFLNKAVAI